MLIAAGGFRIFPTLKKMYSKKSLVLVSCWRNNLQMQMHAHKSLIHLLKYSLSVSLLPGGQILGRPVQVTVKFF